MLRLTSDGEAAALELSLFANELRQYVLNFNPEAQEMLLKTLLDLINQLQMTGHISMQRMCFSCQYFVKDREVSPYYCQLLEKPLMEAELRINCLEHKPKA